MGDAFRDAVQRIKDTADIVNIIGRRVDLKKAGKSFKGLCPFHDEKTPSFNVVPEKGIFHCFGCGEHGSVIDFLMKTEHLEFIEAVKNLAEELKIEIPDDQTPQQKAMADERKSKRQSLLKLNDFALQWFLQNLKPGIADEAIALMKKRNIPDEYAKQFELGASLDDWAKLSHAAMQSGFSRELLIESGLCILHDRKNSLYDRFRNRLMFPIRDHMEQVIGFGGRRLDDDPKSPKYLNSSETALYHKGKSLYGLNIAKDAIAKSGFALITEGYMDTLMAHRFGFPQAIASLGTALTSDQARLIKRFAPKVFFLYDGDSAGRKNMLRAGPSLLEAGLDTRIILLPDGHDPDSYLQEFGADALKNLMSKAPEFYDFALDEYTEQSDLTSLAGQSELVEQIAPIIRNMSNNFQQEAAISRLSKRVHDLPIPVIRQILTQDKPTTSTAQPLKHVVELNRLQSLERNILKLMLQSFEALSIFRTDLNERWVEDSRFADWLLFFLSGTESAEHMLTEIEIKGDQIGDRSIVHELMAEDEPIGTPAHSAHQLVARIQIEHQRILTQNLLKSVQRAHRENPQDIPQSLLRQIHEEIRITRTMKVPNAPFTM